MNAKLIVLGVITLVAYGLFARSAQAGGCCYTFFSSAPGVAQVKDAQLSTGFIYPGGSFSDPLSNKKIEIHVVSAKAGQFCLANTEKTNEQGNIDGHCSSPYAGTMSIYFSSPELNAAENETMRSVYKSVDFTVNPNAVLPTRIPTPQPVSTNKDEITPTPQPVGAEDDTGENEVLNERIASLEKKVMEQQKQVNGLQKIINSLLDFFRNLFR